MRQRSLSAVDLGTQGLQGLQDRKVTDCAETRVALLAILLRNIKRHGGSMNIWAVLLAAVSSFLLGGVWYSRALFGRAWHAENGTVEQKGDHHPAKVFGVSFAFALIAAVIFAYWLGPRPPLSIAVRAGLIAGFGFAATSLGINYQFAQRTLKLWMIDGGYHTAQFLLYGLILGLLP
ncbi:MAG: DUF1761 domain-containing protein [Acidobacteriota bacterium]